jgi:hypothetical protein
MYFLLFTIKLMELQTEPKTLRGFCEIFSANRKFQRDFTHRITNEIF